MQPSPDLSSVPPRRMRQLVNWRTRAPAAGCPLRIVSRADLSKLWAQTGSARSTRNRKQAQAVPRDSAEGLSRGLRFHVTRPRDTEAPPAQPTEAPEHKPVTTENFYWTQLGASPGALYTLPSTLAVQG